MGGKPQPPEESAEEDCPSGQLQHPLHYIYPATSAEGSLFWDGAVMANTPLNAAIEAGADEIIVVLLAPMPGQAGGWPLPRHPFQIIPLVLDLALLATFENDYRQLEAANRTDPPV